MDQFFNQACRNPNHLRRQQRRDWSLLLAWQHNINWSLLTHQLHCGWTSISLLLALLLWWYLVNHITVLCVYSSLYATCGTFPLLVCSVVIIIIIVLKCITYCCINIDQESDENSWASCWLFGIGYGYVCNEASANAGSHFRCIYTWFGTAACKFQSPQF